MTENQNNGDIIMIIDESGSMEIMGEEAVQSASLFLKEQKEIGVKDTNVSVWKFNNKVTKIINECPLSEKDEFSFSYNPEGSTAMYDAIGQAITEKLDSDRSEGNICLILTDGLDNSSRKFKLQDVKNLIKDSEENHSWKFVFVGANIDSWSIGGNMGVGRCINFKATPEGISDVFRQTSDSIGRYRSGDADDI